MPTAILITQTKNKAKKNEKHKENENENFVKDIREAFARRAFVKDILEGFHPSKHFALTRRPRQSLYNKSCCLKIASHLAFRAVSNEHSPFI